MAAIGNEDRDLRMSDIKTFLKVHESSLLKNADNFNKLFATVDGQPVTTTIGQLKRVMEFLLKQKPNLSPGRGPGFEKLFAEQPGGWLKPTEAAEELYARFRDLDDLYEKARTVVQEKLAGVDRSKVSVRIGVPETIGYQWVAHACSCWKQLFGDELQLHLKLSPSLDLLRHLNAGDFLDAVFAYGWRDTRALPPRATVSVSQVKEDLVERPYENLCFRSFAYPMEMVLLSHPACQIRLREQRPGESNPNWTEEKRKEFKGGIKTLRGKIEEAIQSTYQGEDSLTKAEEAIDVARVDLYNCLRTINPRNVDYSESGETPLIVVPSYAEPIELKLLIDDVRARYGVREAKSYLEAMALVRAGQGVTILNEPYWTRGHLAAFRLTAPNGSGGSNPYRRWVGVYYNATRGLKEGPLKVVAFLRAYVKEFEPFLRAGRSPSWGDQVYDSWYPNWKSSLSKLTEAGEDWLTGSAFPVYFPE